MRKCYSNELLTGKDILPEKDLLEKAATMKRFQYSLLGKELKAQTDIAKKQYQKLDDTFRFDKIIKKEKQALENYNKSNLIYNSKHSFYKYYCDSKKFDSLSLKSKYSFLLEFSKDLNKFKESKTKKQKTEKKKTNVYIMSSELYNNFLEIYYDKYNELSDFKRNKMDTKYDRKNLFLKGYDYNVWSENVKESTDKKESLDLSDMPPPH